MRTHHRAKYMFIGMRGGILGIVAVLLTMLVLLVRTGSAVQARPLAASGSLDGSFNLDGKLTTTFYTGLPAEATGVASQADGKILAVGDTWTSSDGYNAAMVRYTNSGIRDATFSADGRKVVSLGGYEAAMAVGIHRTSQKIIVVGKKCATGWDPCDSLVLRLNPGGALDSTFSGDGKRTDNFGGGNNESTAVAVYPDGRIVAAGYMHNQGTLDYDFALMRYTAAGSLDTTFSSDGKQTIVFGADRNAYATAVVLQQDGKILIAGYTCISSGGDCNFALARLNENGTLDTSFAGDGRQTTDFGADEYAYGLALQPDEKIILAGSKSTGTTTSFALARYTTGGGLDITFSGDGKQVTNFSGDAKVDVARAVQVQPNGKIVVCGVVYDNAASNFALARYNPGGGLDTTFSTDGKTTVDFGQSDCCQALAIQPDGKYVLAGISYSPELVNWVVARILP